MGITNRRNLFIVGAGASAEFGLPTGKALLREISRAASQHYDSRDRTLRTTVDDTIQGAIDTLIREEVGLHGATGERVGRFRNEAVWICRNASLAPSIDNLLHTHQNNTVLTEIGKVLIAKALIDAEQKSSLFVRRDENQPFSFFSEQRPHPSRHGEKISPTESWLAELFWLLVELRDYPAFLEALKNITFISFNYDRCVEYFITSAAWSYFRLNENQAKEVLSCLDIVRPYGGLGELKVNGDRLSGFGAYDQSLNNTAKGVRTFTEGVSDMAIVERIERAFNEAELVFFMGFGFLELNLKLLLGDKTFNAKRVVGTRKGLSDESASIVCNYLQERLFFGKDSPELRLVRLPVGNDKLELSDMTCRELLSKHQFFLRGQQ